MSLGVNMDNDWGTLKALILEHPVKHTTCTARMPRDCDAPISIGYSTVDGIYPIRQGIHMKKRNPTIVSVTATKVDPRESDARNMIMWLKSIPVTAIHNPTAYLKIVGEDHRRAVDRLITLADMDFDVTVPGVTKDFLRVRSTDVQYSVTYMEHFPEIENDEERYSSMCLQMYPHVVDAFRCFQMRIVSEQPYKSVRV